MLIIPKFLSFTQLWLLEGKKCLGFCMGKWYWHIAIWLGGYLIVNCSSWTIGAFHASSATYWWVSFYGTIINAILVYAQLFYFIPRFLNRQGWWRYISATVLLIGGLSLLESLLDFALVPWFIASYVSTFREFLTENILLHTFLFFFPALIYKFSSDWFRHQQLQQRLREEKLQAELALLKAQVSPHFLFNALNNLFASAQQHGDQKTAAGIAQLGELMRYMLEDSVRDLVPLAQELSYLNAYIALQEMRLGQEDPVRISFVHTGEVEAVYLPPLLLIPFIENAFKHGVQFFQPSFVDIQLEVTGNDQLEFKVINSCHEHNGAPSQEPSGWGLKNLRKRLELHYPQRFQLETTNKGHSFEAILRLDLHAIKD